MTYTHQGQDLSVSYGDLLVIFPQSPSHFPLGFHHSRVVLVVKKLPVNAEDIRNAGSILGSGRSPRGGHGNPFQYSCPWDSMDRGTWQAIESMGSHRVRHDRSYLARMHTTIHRKVFMAVHMSLDSSRAQMHTLRVKHPRKQQSSVLTHSHQPHSLSGSEKPSSRLKATWLCMQELRRAARGAWDPVTGLHRVSDSRS